MYCFGVWKLHQGYYTLEKWDDFVKGVYSYTTLVIQEGWIVSMELYRWEIRL